MSPGSDIDFIVAGGARYGLGHVMRSGALAAAATRRGLRVRVYLAGDRVGLARWRSACPDSGIDRWSAWRASNSAPITLFDHPFSKSRWLDACRGDRTRTVVLDDPRAIGRARLTINPALHHAPAPVPGTISAPDGSACADATPLRADSEDDPGSPILCGPRYAILADAHRAQPHPPLAGRDSLLLSIGGADPHGATPRLAPIIDSVLLAADFEHGIQRRRVVLGPAFPDPDHRVEATLLRAGWIVERGLEPPAMAQRMAEARIAVMGFGTSLCELAWHGTPHLSITHHAHDEHWAEALERRGIGGFLGPATDLVPERVAARLEQGLRDRVWQIRSADLARAALEGGRGSERILDRLALIAGEVPRKNAASPPRRSGGRGRPESAARS